MTKTYKASKGKAFPVRIAGRLELITDSKDFPVDLDKIDYFTKNSLDKAVQDKDIVEVTPKAKGSKHE